MPRASHGAWPGRADPSAVVRLYVEGLRTSLFDACDYPNVEKALTSDKIIRMVDERWVAPTR
jgi:hypothetical protein